MLSPDELLPYWRKPAQGLRNCDQQTLKDIRAPMRSGLGRTVREELLLEADVAKAWVRRFDAVNFGSTRQAVMNRGKALSVSDARGGGRSCRP